MGTELDATEEETFAAVGLALTRWESMEASLADLYSVFCGAPFDRRVVVFFGHQYGTTVRRLTGLSDAANRFFRRWPDQDREHAFDTLRRTAEKLSLDRHRIAHGLVDRVTFAFPEGGGVTGFALVAPWYSETRLRFTSRDAWGSAAIVGVSDQFVTLDRSVRAFCFSILSDGAH